MTDGERILTLFAPGAEDTFARMFRENIERTEGQIEELDAMLDRAGRGVGEYETMEVAQTDLLTDGLALLINEKEKMLAGQRDGLEECELVIEANRVLHGLQAILDDDGEDSDPMGSDLFLQDVIALIHRLDAARKKPANA